jgi:hypothetical protein
MLNIGIALNLPEGRDLKIHLKNFNKINRFSEPFLLFYFRLNQQLLVFKINAYTIFTNKIKT